jgi:predicted Zn-dependent peptidase
VVDVCRATLADVVKHGLAPDELARVKTQMKGGLQLGLETSDSRMTRLARSMLYFGRDVSVGEVFQGVDAVENDDVRDAAARMFAEEILNVTVLGPAHAAGA